MTLAMSGATREDSGLASGLVNTTQQVGGALGLAVLATLSTTRSSELRAHGASTAASLTNGYHLAFTIGAGLVLVAIAVAAVLLRPEQKLEVVEEAILPSSANPTSSTWRKRHRFWTRSAPRPRLSVRDQPDGERDAVLVRLATRNGPGRLPGP